MPIRLIGELKTPTSCPLAGVIITLKSIETSADVLLSSSSSITTDYKGRYEAMVPTGLYLVSLDNGISIVDLGQITVFSDSAESTLQALLSAPESEPSPAWLQEIRDAVATTTSQANIAKSSAFSASGSESAGASSAVSSADSAAKSEMFTAAAELHKSAAAISALTAASAANQASSLIGEMKWYPSDPDNVLVRAGLAIPNGMEVSRVGPFALLWGEVDRGNLQSVSESEWQAGKKNIYSTGNGTTTFRLPDLRDSIISTLDLKTVASKQTVLQPYIVCAKLVGVSPISVRGIWDVPLNSVGGDVLNTRIVKGVAPYVATGQINDGMGFLVVAAGNFDLNDDGVVTLAIGDTIVWFKKDYRRVRENIVTSVQGKIGDVGIAWADVGGNYFAILDPAQNYIRSADNMWNMCGGVNRGWMPYSEGAGSNAVSSLGNNSWWFRSAHVNTYLGGSVDVTGNIKSSNLQVNIAPNSGAQFGSTKWKALVGVSPTPNEYLFGGASDAPPVFDSCLIRISESKLTYEPRTGESHDIFHKGNPPSADEVGALPTTNGIVTNSITLMNPKTRVGIKLDIDSTQDTAIFECGVNAPDGKNKVQFIGDTDALDTFDIVMKDGAFPTVNGQPFYSVQPPLTTKEIFTGALSKNSDAETLNDLMLALIQRIDALEGSIQGPVCLPMDSYNLR